MGTPAQGRWGHLWGAAGAAPGQAAGHMLPAPVPASPLGRICPLPAERAAQAAVAGAAPQAAGTEVVVTVEQAGVLVGFMAEQADQRVAVGLLQFRAAPQRGENATGHLRGRERPPTLRFTPCNRRAPRAAPWPPRKE